MSEPTSTAVNDIMQQAKNAFDLYKKKTAAERAFFLQTIADCMEENREVLVQTANAESNLPAARLNGEISRTTGQLKMFANLITEGSWIEAAIDTADALRIPPKPDTRKILLPIGPVVVFGASNFPFAFSTAGGDTASALASGSTVVVKGHSAHGKTSLLIFEAIQKAIEKTGMPAHTVQHVQGPGNTVGKELVKHPLTTGVGFTGSLQGGKALVGYAQQREIPIPVFAEMSSINPVVFLPDTLKNNNDSLAQLFAGSITLGMGQFCTNPGLMIAIDSEALHQYLQLLGDAITAIAPQKMLHTGIAESYNIGLKKMLAEKGITLVAQSNQPAQQLEAQPSIAKVAAAAFLQNHQLHEEVFGPYSLMIICQDKNEMKAVLNAVKGQLTATIMGTATDFENHADIIELQTSLAGRVILNNAPTGVEVNASMVHGGPYPATTDARFTSVGTSAIKRWVRPICFQNFTNTLLPDALKNENPLHIWRLVNNNFTKEIIAE